MTSRAVISVIDDAKLFSTLQISQIDQKVKALGNQFAMDIVILTTNDTGGKSSRDYADDFYDYYNYGKGPNKDGMVFLLDYDNRQAYISTSGSSIRYLTDERIQRILDQVINGNLSKGDNLGAVYSFISATSGFLEAGIPSGGSNMPGTQSSR
jgi:uncharacterized protein